MDNDESRSKDQYHCIPTFILRRYQLRTVCSQPFPRTTSSIAEHVHYFDASNGVLDKRPISQTYRIRDLYKACQDAEAINSVELKLSELESRVALIVDELHAVLPGRVFTLKRGALDDLRKFLFVFPLRHSLANDSIFAARPGLMPLQSWINHCVQKCGCESHAKALLHLLQYHLDNSHTHLIAEGTKTVVTLGLDVYDWLKYGNNVVNDTNDMHAFAYMFDASMYLPCIWEAAEGQEFVLTNRSFGLWEGVYNSSHCTHRVYVISPRLAVVLRFKHLLNEAYLAECSLSSRLVIIKQGPPTFPYGAATHLENDDFVEHNHRFSEEDILSLDVKRLTSTETSLVNEVLLSSVQGDGAVTFTSKTCMLLTARMFCGDLERVRMHRRILYLTWKLEADRRLTGRDGGVDPTERVHVDLCKLLFDMSTGRRKFRSAYDRVRTIIDCIIGQAQMPSVFMSDVLTRTRDVSARFMYGCRRAVPFPLHPWVDTLRDDISTSLFSFLYNVMGQYGFVRHRTADILNVIEDEVVALEFLHEVVWNSEGWYKLMTCDPEAPSLLSELFGSKTPTDEEIARALDTDTVQKCYSSYHNALALYHTVCLSGPTKNPITRDCACCIATVVCDLTVIIPTTVHSERANARLVMQLHRAQWAELVGVVKGLMRSAGLRCRRWAAPEYMCNLTNDIVTIGILYWMAKHRADSLEEFCRAREIALVEIDGDAEEQ